MLLTPKTRVWHKSQEDKNDCTDGLIKLAKENLSKTMIGAEIGSFAGVSTEVFAYYTKEIHAIDPWDLDIGLRGYGEIPIANLKQAELDFDNVFNTYNNIVKYKMTSSKALCLFEDKSLDYVYIDGAHDRDNVLFDIITWKRKLKPRGLLLGHDCSLVLKEVEFLNLNISNIYPDSSWVIIP